MSSKCFNYLNHVQESLEKICITQWKPIDCCAKAMAETIAAGHTVYASGEEPAWELSCLTGRPAIFHVLPPLPKRTVFLPAACKNTPVRTGDFLLLYSVSGKNAAALAMASEARKTDVTTAAVVNRANCDGVSGGPKDGNTLPEVCDIVIDNCGDWEDTSIRLPGMSYKIAPTSGSTGCAILQMLVIRTTEYLLQMGFEPPLLSRSGDPSYCAFSAFNT